MKLQVFTGGLNTRVRPQYIDLTQGAVYSNIDNSVGSLAAVASKTPANIFTAKFAHFHRGTWLSSSTKRYHAVIGNTLYWTDGVNRPQKFNGAVQHNLGIDPPSAEPTLEVRRIDNPVEAEFVSATGGSLPAGRVRYRLVNFDGEYYSGAIDVYMDLSSTTATEATLTDELLDEFGNIQEADNEFESGESPVKIFKQTSLVSTFNRKVTISGVSGVQYGSNGVIIFRQYKGIWRQVGVLFNASSNIVDDIHDISSSAQLDVTAVPPLAGLLQYCYTFYNSTTGVESAPSPLTVRKGVLGKTLITDLQVSSDPQVTKKRLYRVGGNLSSLSLVVELDNAVTSFTDTIKAKDVDGRVLSTAAYSIPPSNLNYLTEAYAMLFAADGTKLRFTPIGKPDAWPELNFLQFDTTVTGVAAVGNGILVFTEFKTHLVTGTRPASLSQQIISNDQGCISAASIQVLGGTALWASTDGICASNGGEVTVISKDALGKVSLSPADSIIHDEVYYILNTSGVILAYDFNTAPIFKNLSLSVESFAIADDVLYGWSNGQLNSLFSNTIQNESMEFLSARLVEGRTTEEKTYKKIYIYSKNDIMLEVFINDQIVLTHQITGEGASQLQIPTGKQRGYFIQFRVTGTGEVYELEYETGRGHGHG